MEKIDYKHGKFVLATNVADYDLYDRRDYMDWQGIDEPDFDEDEFYRWVEDDVASSFEDDLENIRTYEPYKTPVLITGTLGLWWGHPEIQPVRAETVYEAVMKCIDGNDYATVEWEDGNIIVVATHHDGSNIFAIRALSAQGMNRESGDYTDEDFESLKYLYA